MLSALWSAAYHSNWSLGHLSETWTVFIYSVYSVFTVNKMNELWSVIGILKVRLDGLDFTYHVNLVGKKYIKMLYSRNCMLIAYSL